MAIMTDKTLLNYGTELIIDTAATPHTIRLVATGNLTSEGVTLKCVYDALKLMWRNQSTLPPFTFPFMPITDFQFDFGAPDVNWNWYDDATRYLIKSGGWAIKSTSGVSQEEWTNITSLGSIGGSDQPYFIQQALGSVVNFQKTGPVNQAIKVYGDVSHGNFDYRSYLKLFIREYAKTYYSSDLASIGETTMSYTKYGLVLYNLVDTKVTHSDVTVAGYGITTTWYAGPQVRNIGGVPYNFHVIVDGNSKTAEQIYEGVQRLLRQATDIDSGAGTKIGKITNSLMHFTGDDLFCDLDSTGGVYIDNIQTVDANRIHMIDDAAAPRTPPFISAITLNFNSNLIADADAKYWVYFASTPSGGFGTSNAILVQDASGVNITGSVGGASSLTFTFAYDSNTQGGRTGGVDADIIVVAIGLGTAQYTKIASTIGRSTNNPVSLVSSLERNYA